MTRPRRIKPLVRKVPDGTQTAAQHKALEWLKERGGDGLFDKKGVLVAAGERAPVIRSTWNELVRLGLAETYNAPGVRLRLTKRN